MDALEQFWLGLPEGARIGGPWSLAFVLLFSLMRWRFAELPKNAPARGRWVARLRHDTFSRRYREALAGALDWIDTRLSTGLETHPDAEKTEASRAWSAPLLDLCLMLAVMYPALSLLANWVIDGSAIHFGSLEVLQQRDWAWWLRVGVCASVIIGVTHSPAKTLFIDKNIYLFISYFF